MCQLTLTTPETICNLSERKGSSRLAKQHSYELSQQENYRGKSPESFLPLEFSSNPVPFVNKF